MRKMFGLVAVALCLSGAGQDDRPRFHAVKVSDHINVVDPQNALGEPDGRWAEIRPGGELTVILAERLHTSDASDDGMLILKGEGRYGVAGLFKMTEEGESAWLPLAPGGTPGGFKFSSIQFVVSPSTDTIKVANDDTRSVFIDAVVGYGKSGRAK